MRIFLPVYFVVSTLAIFVVRAHLVKRRTGHSPLIERWQDDLRGYVARMLVLSEVLVVLDIVAYAVGGEVYAYTAPLSGLEHPAVQLVGAGLLVATLVWVIVAQTQMGASWRVGVDPDERTTLVTRGIFARSRNPVFLGMRLSLLGLFLVTPNLVAALALLLAEVLMQVQVRIEERYLEDVHGAAFEAYRAQVPRWL